MRKVNNLSTVDKEGWTREEIDGDLKNFAVLYIFLWKENRKIECNQTLYILKFLFLNLAVWLVPLN